VLECDVGWDIDATAYECMEELCDREAQTSENGNEALSQVDLMEKFRSLLGASRVGFSDLSACHPQLSASPCSYMAPLLGQSLTHN